MNIFAYHAGNSDDCDLTDQGYALSFRVPVNLALVSAWVRSEPDNEESLSPMQRVKEEGSWTFWRGLLRLNPSDISTRYVFKLLIDGVQYWLGPLGISNYFPERDIHYRICPTYRPAQWVYSQIFYQIFPERFCDGNPDNNVQDGEYLYEGKPVIAKSWSGLPDRSQGPREFFGGDLAGIRSRLDYLQDLGVTALYLNPIFESPSSHKYDTTNYYLIDPHFGSNEEFALLTTELRQRGMRIVLDAVVNHTSERHPWFDRYAEHGNDGAYLSERATTRDYYIFAGDNPQSYHGWYGVHTLPVLNYASAGVRRAVYEADESILRYWLRPPYQIDGWRFDVIHMLGEGPGAQNNAEFVRQFRQTLRQENPEALVLGEHFFEATNWLQGDQEDAAMNYYGFTLPVWAFLAGSDHRGHDISIDASDFATMLQRARIRLPFEIQLSQFNLLDSHDTPRFLTLLKGDKDLFSLAVVLLFTYIGVPCVYYGDEIGLEGEGDPDCRRPFPWDESLWHRDLRDFYQMLIQLRRSSAALCYGALHILLADGDVICFARTHAQETYIIIINRGPAHSVTLPLWQLAVSANHWRLYDTDELIRHLPEVQLQLKEKSYQILSPVNA